MGFRVFKVKSTSPAQTASLAASLALALARGTVIILEGELGAGKTTFVKGLAAGLDAGGQPRSPSYTLIREYGVLVHADLYRLTAEESARLGWDDYWDGERVLAVEWGNVLPISFWGRSPVVRINFTITGAVERELIFEISADAPPALIRILEGAA